MTEETVKPELDVPIPVPAPAPLPVPKPAVMHSGNAAGADQLFAKKAVLLGHQVVHHVITKGKSKKSPLITFRTYADDGLHEAREFMRTRVGFALNRPWPHSAYSQNLITRNYFQVEETSRLYAVSHMTDTTKGTRSKMNVHIEGGTGWTIQAFVLMALDEIKRTGTSPRIQKLYRGERDRIEDHRFLGPRNQVMAYLSLYMFEQNHRGGNNRWYQGMINLPRAWPNRSADNEDEYSFSWVELTKRNPLPPLPQPGEKYTAVGRRVLTDDGRRAIETLFLLPDPGDPSVPKSGQADEEFPPDGIWEAAQQKYGFVSKRGYSLTVETVAFTCSKFVDDDGELMYSSIDQAKAASIRSRMVAEGHHRLITAYGPYQWREGSSSSSSSSSSN